jgi:hypothetical protein
MPDQSDELRRLIAQALAFERQSKQLALMFDDELARIWREWSRLVEALMRERIADGVRGSRGLQLRAGQVLGLKTSIREALERAGFDTSAIGAVQAATSRWMTVAGDTLPVQSIETTVRTLQQLAARDLLSQGDQAAVQLWRAMAQSVLSPRPVSEIIRDLALTLDRTQAQAATLFDTQMTIFGRQVEAAKTEDLGPEQPFLYSGPVDAKTRDWCLERVGKVFTREEIDAMDNEQLPNVMLTGGGFHCRHAWLAVESRALRGLTGTGERAEGFQEDVNRVRKQKAARKKAA